LPRLARTGPKEKIPGKKEVKKASWYQWLEMISGVYVGMKLDIPVKRNG